MFKNEFQGGAYFEVFSAQGKDPGNHWKMPAGGATKDFDKSVRSYVFILNGSAFTTKMQIPKDSKQSLSLLQRYLLLQVYIPKGQDFSIDVGVQDLNNTKRRLFFSTAHKETQETPLHSKIPIGFVRRDMWLNLCLDIGAVVGYAWKGQTFKSMESISVSASCRLRRIFTMKAQPTDTSHDEELLGTKGTNDNVELDSIPKNFQLATEVPQETQVVTVPKIRSFEGKKPESEVPELDLNSSGGKKSSSQDPYHIAFGTKVSGKKSASREGSGTVRTARGGSAGSKAKGDGDGHRSQRGGADAYRRDKDTSRRERKNSDPGTSKQDDPELTVDKESLRTSHTWTDGADGKQEIPYVRDHVPQPPREPHPPREQSGGATRRKHRVKSAGKERSHQQPDESDRPGLQAPHMPRVVANEDEVANIMSAMMDTSSSRRNSRRSESESEFSSENTSALHGEDGEEDLSDVIQVLNKRDRLPDGQSQPGEYEESDDGDDSVDEDRIYTFSSPPKSAPRTTPKNKKAQKNLTNSQKHRARRRLSSSDKHKDRGAQYENDFIREGSSEEEESINSRVRKKSPNPRPDPTPRTHKNGPNPRPDPTPRTHKNGYSAHMYSSPAESHKPLAIQTRTHNGLLQIPHPNSENLTSPVTSQTRKSISRKSLREIPKDDVRLSQKDKPYNHLKYQMQDLTESFEQQMLLALKRQTMEEGMADSEDDAHQRSKGRMEKLHYGNDSFSDESDDTMSTLRPQGDKTRNHNYQDEMKISKLDQDFLTQSNPRDWGNGVFSPPIVLPNDIPKDQHPNKLSPSNFDTSPKLPQPCVNPPGGDVSDEEEELDLLYDPVLNCYFDPKTMKYYELM